VVAADDSRAERIAPAKGLLPLEKFPFVRISSGSIHAQLRTSVFLPSSLFPVLRHSKLPFSVKKEPSRLEGKPLISPNFFLLTRTRWNIPIFCLSLAEMRNFHFLFFRASVLQDGLSPSPFTFRRPRHFFSFFVSRQIVIPPFFVPTYTPLSPLREATSPERVAQTVLHPPPALDEFRI